MSAEDPTPAHQDAPDLFAGGLLYRVLRRYGINPSSAAQSARRAVLIAIGLWLPMAIASFAAGKALPGSVALPFLLDIAAYVRPLIVIPLFLIADPILEGAWRRAGRTFRERGIIVPEQQGRYDALVARVQRWARAPWADLVCLLASAAMTIRLVTFIGSEPHDTWFATSDGSGGSQLTLAGMWAAWVVHLLFFYLTLRWIWELLLWYRFLFGVSRMPLHLYPTHPDQAGGLAFLGRTIGATAPLIFAGTAAMNAAAANGLLHRGHKLPQYLPLGIVEVVFMLLLYVLPPILAFGPLLTRTRREALDEWGHRMARTGETVAAKEEGMSLEEVDIAVTAVRAMKPFPFLRTQLFAPLAAVLVPAIPLLFLAFPARDILDKVLHLLF